VEEGEGRGGYSWKRVMLVNLMSVLFFSGFLNKLPSQVRLGICSYIVGDCQRPFRNMTHERTRTPAVEQSRESVEICTKQWTTKPGEKLVAGC
jgi:hypothetical protein